MSTTIFPYVLFISSELLPAAWRHLENEGPVWTFNPALLKQRDGWIIAYRIIGADQVRRVALCRLDSDYRVIKNSHVPLSDHVTFPSDRFYLSRIISWFADPRLYTTQSGKIFLHWNSGRPDRGLSSQFMVELDTTALLPLHNARELHLQGRRELVEKNWGFFESELRHAVYLPEPHQILRCNFEDTSELACHKTDTTTWDNTHFSRQWGVLRGGAPPQLVDGEYYSVGHSVRNGALGRITVAAVYSFSANSPFQPTRRPLHPLLLPNPFGSRTELPRLNPETEETVYPSGAIYHNGLWSISYGLNDEHCAITIVPHEDLLNSMESIVPVPSSIIITKP